MDRTKPGSQAGPNPEQVSVAMPDQASPQREPAAPQQPPAAEKVFPMFAGLEGQVVAGRYQVLSKLGEGGMGIVYLAEHITIEKKVALKVLLHEYARKSDLKDRFLQEAKAAAKIGHENIVDITDFGDTPDGSVFFAMEYLEGQDLSQVVRKGGPVQWSRAKPILLQIGRALGAAHSKGIVHRDMKPENIYLIQREGRDDFVKLLDFGIAKMSVEDGEKRLTRTGMIFGTPEYMSPEQAQGNKPDHRVDIYAVGVIMYELLTGNVPFKADTFMGILTKHIFENPVPPSQAAPEAQIPHEVEQIILKAMAKDRAERFQSMTELSAAIAQASGRMTRPTGDHAEQPPRRISSPSQTYSPLIQTRGTVTEIPPPPRKRLPLVIGVIVAVVVLGGVAAAVMMRGGDPSPGPDPSKKDPVPVVTPAGKPDATVVAATVKVRISSSPAGAEVFRGGLLPGKKPEGITPAVVKLPRNDRKVAFTLRLDGYQDGTIEVVPDREKEVITKLTRRQQVSVTRPPPPPRPPPPTPTQPVPKRPEPKTKRPQHVDDLMNPFREP